MTEPSPRFFVQGGGFIRAQNLVNLSYDKLWRKISFTYDKQNGIMILR